MNKINLARDIEIYILHAWGESAQCLAEKHHISQKRVYNIVREQKHRAAYTHPRCVVCGHSGSMHHTDDWEYDRGPCAAYLCECPAMEALHD